MRHSPFDVWLFDPQELTADQAHALQEHLQACPSCRALSAALVEVETSLQAEPEWASAPGFARRWQARLTESRSERKRRQAWAMVGGTVGAGLALSWVVGVQLWSMLSSPADVANELLSRLKTMFAQAGMFQDFLPALGRILQDVPAVWWLVVIVVGLWLSGLWGTLVYRYVIKNARNGVSQ
ncbi:MAG: zf-HC2 domain-containing protein [Anaerolineales bacterium]|jgi:anti-sigma factor RsiW